MATQNIDVKEITSTLQQTILPLFWGAIATAVVVPIAVAGGTWVAKKVFKPEKEERR